ncbi:MAG: hypothetical protein [Caudoviricetes sp.]|nr:MAG: hypothetical protein [Caudoviricetes sp.]
MSELQIMSWRVYYHNKLKVYLPFDTAYYELKWEVNNAKG